MPLKFKVNLKEGPFVGVVIQYLNTELWLFAYSRSVKPSKGIGWRVNSFVLKYGVALEAGS